MDDLHTHTKAIAAADDTMALFLSRYAEFVALAQTEKLTRATR